MTALVDGSDGDVVERYMYSPYGEVEILDADWSADDDGESDYNNAILYCGYYHDSETGLYHVRRRYYHPPLGRWTSRDPVGYADGMGLYEYVAGSPCTYSDPRGTDRYITQFDPVGLNTGGKVQIHVGVAVDRWVCRENGVWSKHGQVSFHFRIEYEAYLDLAQKTSAEIGGLAFIGGAFYGPGKVIEVPGGLAGQTITFKSDACQDRWMLQYLRDMVANPPFYSGLAYNCLFWSVGAVSLGMDKSCEEECCFDEDVPFDDAVHDAQYLRVLTENLPAFEGPRGDIKVNSPF